MLYTFTNTSGSKFTVNGREFFKTFVPFFVNDTQVKVLNIFDSKLALIPRTNVSDIEVDGVTYATSNELITAIGPVIYVLPDVGGISEGQIQLNAQNISALQQDITSIDNQFSNYYTQQQVDNLINGISSGGSSITSGIVEGNSLKLYDSLGTLQASVNIKSLKEQGTVLIMGENGKLQLKNQYGELLSEITIVAKETFYDEFLYVDGIAPDFSDLSLDSRFMVVKTSVNQFFFISDINNTEILEYSRLYILNKEVFVDLGNIDYEGAGFNAWEIVIDETDLITDELYLFNLWLKKGGDDDYMKKSDFLDSEDSTFLPQFMPDLAITDLVIASETSIAEFCDVMESEPPYIFQKGDVIQIIDEDEVLLQYRYNGGDQFETYNYSLINASKISISNVIALQAALDAKLTGISATDADLTAGTSTTKFPAVKRIVDWITSIKATAVEILAGTGSKLVSVSELKTAKDSISWFDNAAMSNLVGTWLMGWDSGVASPAAEIVEQEDVINNNDIISVCVSASINTTETVYANVVANYFCSDNNKSLIVTPTNNATFPMGTYFAEGDFFYMAVSADNTVERICKGSANSEPVPVLVLDTNIISEQYIPLIANNLISVIKDGVSYRVTEDSVEVLDAFTVYYDRTTGRFTINAAATGDTTYYIIHEK